MKKIISWNDVKQCILTGISYFIPLVVGAGLTMAIGRAIAGTDVANLGTSGIGYWMYQTGNLGMQLMVPMLCAYIAFSLGEKPALAPGFIIGWVAYNLNTGFIGGMLGGVLIGIIVRLCKEYIHLPASIASLKGMLVIPFLATAIGGIIMYAVIQGPITWLMAQLTAILASLSSGSRFLYGGVLGAFVTFDFGGPVNKAATAFVNALYTEGITDAKVVQIMCSMTQPFGIAIAALIARNKFTKAEKETLKAAVPMGCFMISEGVIPIAARDLVRVVFACVCGAFVCGGLSMMWGNSSELLNGGFIAFPFFGDPLRALLCLAIGSVVTGVILAAIKKPVDQDEESDALDLGEELSEDELEDLDIEIM